MKIDLDTYVGLSVALQTAFNSWLEETTDTSLADLNAIEVEVLFDKVLVRSTIFTDEMILPLDEVITEYPITIACPLTEEDLDSLASS